MSEAVATTVNNIGIINTYSIVQGFFFTSPPTPAENCSEPPLQSPSTVHREPADLPRSCGGILSYLYKRMERQSYPPQTIAVRLPGSFNRRVQSFSSNTHLRGGEGAGEKKDCTVSQNKVSLSLKATRFQSPRDKLCVRSFQTRCDIT